MSQETLSSTAKARSMAAGSVYEHYKGSRYKIIGIARHSETLEEMVVYQAQYGQSDRWVRPLNIFLENVLINGQLQPRFKLI